MTRPKRYRLYFILGTLACVSFSAAVVLTLFQEGLVFFYTPSELLKKTPEHLSKSFRLGGLVVEGSVHHQVINQVPHVTFVLSDGTRSQKVIYQGILPDLFREGQGIVAEGTLQDPLDLSSPFQAITVLAKHDETYMPPEVAKGLTPTARLALEKSLSSP